MSALRDLADLLTAAGAVQGAMLAVLAWRRSAARPALAWFALLMAALAVLLALDHIEDRGLTAVAISVGLLWVLLVPAPAFWLYVRRMLGRAPLARTRALLHFAPALLLLPPSLYFAHALHGATDAELAQIGATAAWRIWHLVIIVATIAGGFAYLGLAFVWLRRHRRALHQVLADAEAHELPWLRRLLLLAVLILVAFVLGVAIDSEPLTLLAGMAQPFAMLWIGIRALEQPAILGFSGLARAGAAVDAAPIGARAEGGAETRASYARSGLTLERAEALKQRLDELMAREKPFLEQDLTLGSLAARLDTTPQLLSQLLNQQLGRSFHDFVADHRVQDVVRCLGDPNYDGQTVLELADAAGFRSKSAFHDAFRRMTGTTPTRFRSRRGLAAPAQSGPDDAR